MRCDVGKSWLLSTSVLIATYMIITAVLFTLIVAQFYVSPQQGEDPDVIGLVVSDSILGMQVSLYEARQLSVFPIRTPQSLPPDTFLERVYVSGNGTVVRLFYVSWLLPDAQAFGGSLPFTAQLVIHMRYSEHNPLEQVLGPGIPPIVIEVRDRDGLRVVQTIQQDPVGSLISVCDVRAFGRESAGNEPGILVWWADKIEYTIIAKLPLSELIKIANSMC